MTMIARVTLGSLTSSGRLEKYGTFFLPINNVSRPRASAAAVTGISAMTALNVPINTGMVGILTRRVCILLFVQTGSRPQTFDPLTSTWRGTTDERESVLRNAIPLRASAQ